MKLSCRPVQYLEIRITVFHKTRKGDFNYPELFCNQGRRIYMRKKCWGRWTNEIVDYSRATMWMPPQAFSKMFNSSTKVSTPADF